MSRFYFVVCILLLNYSKYEHFFTVQGRFVFNVQEFKENLIPKYQDVFLTFATRALQTDPIANSFLQSAVKNVESAPPGVASRQATLKDLKQTFKSLETKVKSKYSIVLKNLKTLKVDFVKGIENNTKTPLPRAQYPCCDRSSPQVLRYHVRYREAVNTSQGCVGRTRDTFGQPFSLRVEEAFKTMKVKINKSVNVMYVITREERRVPPKKM